MGLYSLTALSVFAGFLLDCLFGDPLNALHPVVPLGASGPPGPSWRCWCP